MLFSNSFAALLACASPFHFCVVADYIQIITVARSGEKKPPPTPEALAGLTISLTLSGAVALNWQKAARLKISH